MPRRDEPHPMGLELARRVAELRAERGMTLGKLASETGISKGHLSNVERGLAVITIMTLDRIARGFGVEVFYLLVFPQKSIRDRCVERIRALSERDLKAILAQYPRRKPRPPRK
jgi:transcriptional regulator with XRE-family HTH domain